MTTSILEKDNSSAKASTLKMKRSPEQTLTVDRILVVDDIYDNSFLLQTVLEQEGYHVEVVDSGPAALTTIEAEPPDLVLLDVMMPGMSGYEVTKRIRENASLPFIPILLISGHEQASVAQGFDMGADGFIRKPIDFNQLLERVRAILPK